MSSPPMLSKYMAFAKTIAIHPSIANVVILRITATRTNGSPRGFSIVSGLERDFA